MWFSDTVFDSENKINQKIERQVNKDAFDSIVEPNKYTLNRVPSIKQPSNYHNKRLIFHSYSTISRYLGTVNNKSRWSLNEVSKV